MMGHFQIKDAEKTYKHAFPPQIAGKVLTKLKERRIDFTIKKKKLFGSTALETQAIELRGFNAKSVLDKYVTL